MAVEKKVSPEESLKSTLATIEKQFGKGADKGNIVVAFERIGSGGL